MPYPRRDGSVFINLGVGEKKGHIWQIWVYRKGLFSCGNYDN